MKSLAFGLVNPEHLKRALKIPLAEFAMRCGYCKALIQFGRYGIYAHTRVVHPNCRPRPVPLSEEESKCHWSSTPLSQPKTED